MYTSRVRKFAEYMEQKFPEKEINNQSTRASLELLYDISHEIAAALDLRTVLQKVLFLSTKKVGAINGSIIVVDDEGQPLESAIVTGSQFYDNATQQLRVTYERGLAGWVLHQRQAVLIPDTSIDERWVRRPDDAEDQTGPKSAVSAPILAREKLVGVMTLVHPMTGFFTEDHLALIHAIADQAGIAILNARLYDESQRKARVMTALAESATVITASLNLDDVLKRILKQISQALRVEVVSLALIDPKTEDLVFRASTGKRSQNVVGIRLARGQGIAGWVAIEGRGVIAPVAYKDHRFYPGVDKQIGFKTKAIACAPIRLQDKVIGVMEALNPVEGSFDAEALSVLTGIGSLAGTAIHNAQLFERLQAAVQRYLELFEDSIDPILITDQKGHIVEANRPARLILGVEDNSILGIDINQLHVVNPDILGADYEDLTSGSTRSYEASLLTQAGREIPVQVYVRAVLIEDISHIQWILRDITERKNLDNLRNDLISMIYHDLRSPLANVVSSLDVLESLVPDEADPAQKSLLDIAIRSTERIQRLTNSLLDIRRLEAGQPIGNYQSVTPKALAQDAVEIVLPILENKRQEIVVNVPEDLPKISVDRDMIQRVLTNLLENAVKYTPPASKIFVGAEPVNGQVILWVQDTGPGIPPNEAERIFDKFTRLHSQGGQIGFGLGLAFCRLAVEAHGGRIWVESGSDSGACFKFTLPVEETQ